MLIDSLQREAHVWFTVPESVRDDAVLQRLEAVLSDEELGRYRRFHFPEDRHRYLVSHALVREALSHYSDIAPADWCFSRREHGRPEIANPGIPPLRFNLTHTAGLACCIVTLDDDCGIDAEKITARHASTRIAKRMFSEAEYRELQQLQGQQHLEYFFTRWTLREAYVKARGIGIFHPTGMLTFTLAADGSFAVSGDAGIDNNKEALWNFQLLKLSEAHITATALHGIKAGNKTIGVHRLEFSTHPASGTGSK